MNLGRKPIYIRHRDDEWFDEVRIVCVPRWKTSELSGDEWRVSYTVKFLRKGQVLKERTFGRLRYALVYAPTMPDPYAPAGNDEDKKFQNESIHCAQPGCSEIATVEYKLNVEYCNRGEAHTPHSDLRIRFCAMHSKRGDCGLQDADRNYTDVPLVNVESRTKEVEQKPELTKERLAEALDEAGFPDLSTRARTGEFSDFEGPHATPKVELVTELLKMTNGGVFAKRVIAGEFDDTREESEAWFRSQTGSEKA